MQLINNYIQKLRYYRNNMKTISSVQHELLLEELIRLNRELKRPPLISLQRKLREEYGKKGKFVLEEQMAETIYEQTTQTIDRIRLLRVIMFIRSLNESEIEELVSYVADTTIYFRDRVDAAEVLMFLSSMISLRSDVIQLLDKFYVDVIYSNREKLSIQKFCHVTITYTFLIYTYLPEKEGWGLLLREKLLNICPENLLPRLLGSYIFQSNIDIACKYNQAFEDASRKSNSNANVQVSYTHGLFITLLSGDILRYEYYKQRVAEIDEIYRNDVRLNYFLYSLYYVTEWNQTEQLDETLALFEYVDVPKDDLPIIKAMLKYLSYKTHQDINYLNNQQWKNSTSGLAELFIKAIQSVQNSQYSNAITYFSTVIDSKEERGHDWNIIKSWAYRELVELLMNHDKNMGLSKLNEYRQFIQKTACLVFWPDFYRLYALYLVSSNDIYSGLINYNKAIIGYLAIAKNDQAELVKQQLEQTLASYFYKLQDKPIGSIPNQLVINTQQYLIKYLNLKHYASLCEKISQSSDLEESIQKLTFLLLDNFPIVLITIQYRLSSKNKETYYSKSGEVSEEVFNELSKGKDFRRLNMTFEVNETESIIVALYTYRHINIKQDIEDFVPLIKPHVSHAILKNEMMVDTLTSFYLRKYFLPNLEKEFTISKKYDLDISLLMLDIDDFRKVNNEYGHQEGDRVLKKVATIIQSKLGQVSIPGRYGGEEFLIILPKTDGKIALQVAERIRRQIEKEFSTGRDFIKITVSIGVSSLSQCKASSPEQLINMADLAEIKAKKQGKNRVVSAWE